MGAVFDCIGRVVCSLANIRLWQMLPIAALVLLVMLAKLTYGEGRKFTPSHPFPAEALAKQIRLGWSRGAANVLLATAPDYTGQMRPEDVEQLRRLGRILREEES